MVSEWTRLANPDFVPCTDMFRHNKLLGYLACFAILADLKFQYCLVVHQAMAACADIVRPFLGSWCENFQDALGTRALILCCFFFRWASLCLLMSHSSKLLMLKCHGLSLSLSSLLRLTLSSLTCKVFLPSLFCLLGCLRLTLSSLVDKILMPLTFL